MRKKPNLIPRFERCANLLIENPEQMKGQWRSAYNFKELHVEIGCGKGRFITETAKQNPEIMFIGIEREKGALVIALEKVAKEEILNLMFIAGDAIAFNDIFDNGELDRIYINFCDPWPKSKQEKRRLTYRSFLDMYNRALCTLGSIFFKTDNKSLFDFSLKEMSEFGFALRNTTFDLHATDMPNVVTEYEERFSSQGVKINRCECWKNK